MQAAGPFSLLTLAVVVVIPSPESYQGGDGDAGCKGGAGSSGNHSSLLKAVIYFSLIVKLLQIAQKLFKDSSD